MERILDADAREVRPDHEPVGLREHEGGVPGRIEGDIPIENERGVGSARATETDHEAANHRSHRHERVMVLDRQFEGDLIGHLRDRDLDRLGIAQRRIAIVGDSDRDRVHARCLCLGRRPREVAGRRDGRARRSACVEAEGQPVCRQVGVGGRRGEGERLQSLHRLVSDRVEHGGEVDLVHRNRDLFLVA